MRVSWRAILKLNSKGGDGVIGLKVVRAELLGLKIAYKEMQERRAQRKG